MIDPSWTAETTFGSTSRRARPVGRPAISWRYVSRCFTESALCARDITKSYGDHVVLNGVDLIASPGQRLGLVGENGVGKSTLLRILAGVEAADGGEVTRPSDIGYLAQELPPEAGRRVADVLEAALAEPHELTRRVEQLAADPDRLDEYADVLEQAVARDAWDADRQASGRGSR